MSAHRWTTHHRMPVPEEPVARWTVVAAIAILLLAALWALLVEHDLGFAAVLALCAPLAPFVVGPLMKTES